MGYGEQLADGDELTSDQHFVPRECFHDLRSYDHRSLLRHLAYR